MWRHHKLQARDDVSCHFGGSSLSSMSTLTVIASLSSVRAFPVQEPKYSTRGQGSQQAVKLKNIHKEQD